jgi:ATP-dependent helicase/nuclease subunit A
MSWMMEVAMSVNRETIIQNATKYQQRAADPALSVWVSANAGTGKTRVLTTRILRLLINGARVSEIMGITYTRAAAAEMRNRIYDNLAEWAVIDQSELEEKIVALGITRPTQKQISTARSLFARLLDAPTSIRIETVHAFCQSVLRRFPFEAGIQPYFELTTDLRAKALREEAISDVLSSQDDDVQKALSRLAESVTEFNLMKPVMAMFQYDALFDRIRNDPAEVKRNLFEALGCIDAMDDPYRVIADLTDDLVDVPDEDRIRFFAEKCSEGTATEERRGETLRAWLDADSVIRNKTVDDYVGVFLTQKMTIRKNAPTAALNEKYPELEESFKIEAGRLVGIKSKIRAIETATLTAALYLIAGRIFAGYRNRKINAGLMDYDDLISHTSHLLQQDGGASWVRYKLDQGITHLLIDEAQDTSPMQWEILKSLAGEFFTGDEEIDKDRSLFSVGDYKQSIYSFQGARPELFKSQCDVFKEMARTAHKSFVEVDLDTSFRTTSPVLNIVDGVIKPEGSPLPGIGDSTAHQVSRIGDAGFVEVLDADPFIIKQDDPAIPFTVHRKGEPAGPDQKLAVRIMHLLKDWIGEKELPSKGRTVRAGDIMILVRRGRNKFTKLLDRELRRSGLPVAGADRVKLIDEIAVMDLVALGQVMLLPEDNLSLAVVLKSPLFGLDEDALFALAHDRGSKTIQQRLAVMAKDDDRFTAAHRQLTEWLGLAEIVPPSQFFRAVLTPEIRKSFASRLGAPVVDVLAEFLTMAREFEETTAPSMQLFLAAIKDPELEMKRESSVHDADEIRIMTMHGAKGLESPIVVLPHLMDKTYKAPDLVDIETSGGTLPVVPPSGGFQVRVVEEAKQNHKNAWQEEENRLLYVAMTRAEDGLVVAGFGTSEGQREGSFYERVRSVVEQHPDMTANESGDGIKVEQRQTAAVKIEKKLIDGDVEVDLPPWFEQPALEETSPGSLSPSRYAAMPPAHSPTGQVRKQAMLRGSLTHRLLEVLPDLGDDARQRAASRILAPLVSSAGLTRSDADTALAETMRLLNNDQLKDIFGEGSRAEVPLSGMIGDQVVSGVVDRLVIGDDMIKIIDFKTGQSPTADQPISPTYITQQGIYVHVLSQIWQDRPIRAGLIYTEDASLHWLDEAEMKSKISSLIKPSSSRVS